MDKKSINNRLWVVIKEKADGEHTVFARKAGIPVGTFQSYAEGRIPHAKHLIRIRETYGVNINWLLTGLGLKYTDEIVIEVHPRIVATGDQARLTETSEDYQPVALVEGKIAAGPGLIVPEDIESYILVRRQDLGRRKHLVAVQIGEKEKSMKPTLKPGCIVVIDKDDKTLVKKGIYAVRLGDDECAIKRIYILKKTILLLSDNPAYAPMLADTTDLDQLIIGRVIWSCRNLLK